MSAPKRVRMSRQHSWRADNPDAVVVARPSKWGNPFKVVPVHRSGPFDVVDNDGDHIGQSTGIESAREIAVRRFRSIAEADPGLGIQIRHDLAGLDLACWCPLDQPCHADVLLDIANRST